MAAPSHAAQRDATPVLLVANALMQRLRSLGTAPLCAALVIAQPLHADEPPDAVAGGSTDDVLDLVAPLPAASVPLDQPGTLLGPRTPGPSESIAPPGPGPNEWFGQSPPWEWTRLTGDWAGARTWLEEQGVTFESSLTLEWGDAISGGTASKWVARNYFDASLSFDTERLFSWHGGTFYAQFATTYTPYGGTFVPVTQWSSNIELAENTTQISNLWYEQLLLDDRLRLKFGKIDPTLEFAYLEAAAGFLNLSALYPPSMPTVPTYSYSGLGGVAYAYPCDHFYLGVGVFDAGLEPDTFIRSNQFEDVYLMGETGLTWEALGGLHDGRLSLGGWWDSSEAARVDGTGTEPSSWGLYALAQQHLWRPEGTDGERGLWAFGQFGYGDEEVILPSMSIGGGLVLRGVCTGREGDALGVYASHVQYSSDAGLPGNETVIELFYGLQVTPAVTITPDIQFFLDPSGDDTVTDPIVFTVRLELTF